jgi:hypothetical protein
MPTYEPMLLDVRVKRTNGYAWIEMKSVLRMDVMEPALLYLCA